MKNKIKTVKIGLVVSVLGFIISSINLICSRDNEMSRNGAISLFFAMIIIFCSNIINYRSQKNNGNNSDK